ncbi:uncharacterized protein FOMMEDRAFT_156844 [Fomitiporia mediterranea MF3/22]|uniref:uncharacterized protein n=1 Tax=Fomitiporia mediterranea (strain MF3/22) TaxID=694068 RepID=UPI0004408471|nr:uncharacterized protein FOMMEDRAFT_156844 [Fomitiporia mediterranea MF3/22]EJD03436.1 hypothetical protein FOMMEDRAFT_156844 [Fomitiporia mediterranea MF3/22]
MLSTLLPLRYGLTVALIGPTASIGYAVPRANSSVTQCQHWLYDIFYVPPKGALWQILHFKAPSHDASSPPSPNHRQQHYSDTSQLHNQATQNHMSSGYGGNAYGGNHNQQHNNNDTEMTNAQYTSSPVQYAEEPDSLRDSDWDLSESDITGAGGIFDGIGGPGTVRYGNIKPTDPKAAAEKKKSFQVQRQSGTSEKKRSSTGGSKEKRKSTVMTRPLSTAEKMGQKKK